MKSLHDRFYIVLVLAVLLLSGCSAMDPFVKANELMLTPSPAMSGSNRSSRPPAAAPTHTRQPGSPGGSGSPRQPAKGGTPTDENGATRINGSYDLTRIFDQRLPYDKLMIMEVDDPSGQTQRIAYLVDTLSAVSAAQPLGYLEYNIPNTPIMTFQFAYAGKAFILGWVDESITANLHNIVIQRDPAADRSTPSARSVPIHDRQFLIWIDQPEAYSWTSIHHIIINYDVEPRNIFDHIYESHPPLTYTRVS